MAQNPRTPVHFTGMKIRGRRNKTRSAARHQIRTVVPHTTVTHVSPNEARFDVIAKWVPGCYRIEITRTTDGWGREVEPQRMQVFPAPEPRPEPTYTVQLKVENKVSDEFWAKLFGERAS